MSVATVTNIRYGVSPPLPSLSSLWSIIYQLSIIIYLGLWEPCVVSSSSRFIYVTSYLPLLFFPFSPFLLWTRFFLLYRFSSCPTTLWTLATVERPLPQKDSTFLSFLSCDFPGYNFFSEVECTKKVFMHSSNLTLDPYSLLTDFSIWALKKGYKEGRKWGPSALYWTILESYGHHAFIALFHFVSNSNSQNNENFARISKFAKPALMN